MLSLLMLAALLSVSAHPLSESTQWTSLAPGMDLKLIADSKITVVRIDPALWEFEFAAISRTGETAGHTVREWCERYRFAVAINAGMYQTDAKPTSDIFKSVSTSTAGRSRNTNRSQRSALAMLRFPASASLISILTESLYREFSRT